MGLMSDHGFEKDNETLGRMIHKAHEMGVKDGHDPFITLSFMACRLFRRSKYTERRFDVEAWKFYKIPGLRECNTRDGCLVLNETPETYL